MVMKYVFAICAVVLVLSTIEVQANPMLCDQLAGLCFVSAR